MNISSNFCFLNFYLDKEDECSQIKEKPEAEGTNDKKTKSGRHAYIHKPYLYSKYYSDSDDERTVEQRRQSVVSLIALLSLSLMSGNFPG